jgi:surfeit locus 1 family protein
VTDRSGSPARSLRFWVLTVAALAGAAVTLSLGAWQWGRAQQKLALQAATEQRQALPALEADALLAAPGSPDLLHRAVALRGRWLGEHTVYLDNRQMGGRPGFYVVTPLQLAGRSQAVLVQRGWVPRDFQDRSRLPPVQTPAGEVTVTGRIALAPAKLYEFEGGATGPIRQNLDLSAFRAETRLDLLDGSVQQVGPPSEGLLRDWPVPASGADKNYGYAFQWWALSAVIVILYVWFQFIVPRRRLPRD